jgi:hypothetical protein
MAALQALAKLQVMARRVLSSQNRGPIGAAVVVAGVERFETPGFREPGDGFIGRRASVGTGDEDTRFGRFRTSELRPMAGLNGRGGHAIILDPVAKRGASVDPSCVS